AAKGVEMMVTGKPCTGKEAHSLARVNHVVADEQLFAEASKLASMIGANSKPTINHIMHLLPFAKSKQFVIGAQAEAEAFGEIFGSEDAKEGIQAFMEKRKPNFKDK